MTMKISQSKVRELVVKRFNIAKTCGLALQLCVLVRANRPVLTKKDVQSFCSQVAKLCKEYGCKHQSELCFKAVESLMDDNERKYLEICMNSCSKCGAVATTLRNKKTPKISEPSNITYVA